MIRTAAPRCDPATGGVTSHVLTPSSELALNRWGIPEPTAAEIVPERELDWILVPLLCFDRRGHRVGYGKGFYDRFLASCRADARKVGVSLLPPADCIGDVNQFDVPLDFCLEGGVVWKFSER
jgi:5-formyltetrahydrofolate cyclo-ligase